MKISKKDLSLDKEFIITNGIGRFCSSSILGINTRRYHGLLVSALNAPANRTLICSKVDESINISGNEIPFYSYMTKDVTKDGYKYMTSFEKNEFAIFNFNIEDIEVSKTITMNYGKNTTAVLYKIKNPKNEDIELKLTPLLNFRNFHELNYKEIEYNLAQDGNCLEIILNKNMYCPISIYCNDGIFVQSNASFKNMYYKIEEERGFDCIENQKIVGTYCIVVPKQSFKEIAFFVSTDEITKDLNIYDIFESQKARLRKKVTDAKINPKKLYSLYDFKKAKKSVLQNYSDEDVKQKLELDKKINEQITNYIYALDNFIVYRKSFAAYTTIAGYPWFLDWGRDSLIAYDGLLLTKDFKVAKDVLHTFSKKIKKGLVPNGFSEDNNIALYNSSDASLLLIDCVDKYICSTGDKDYIYNRLYKRLKQIMKSYINGTDLDDNNIYLDKDYLLNAGKENTQNTWMDAKVKAVAVTPRNGKAVELNALMYNALKIMEKLAKQIDDQDYLLYHDIAKNMKKSFNKLFYNQDKKALYDVIKTNGEGYIFDDKIRPNMLYAISLKYPIIDPVSQVARNIINTTENLLLTPYGLKTLAQNEEGFIGLYRGNELSRDSAYHNGITWSYLLGIYYDALKNIRLAYAYQRKKEKEKYEALNSNNVKLSNSEKEKTKEIIENLEKSFFEIDEKILNFRKDVYNTFSKEFEKGCIGQISEIYDSYKPYKPNGCFAQNWSISEILKIILGA